MLIAGTGRLYFIASGSAFSVANPCWLGGVRYYKSFCYMTHRMYSNRCLQE